MKNRLRTLCLCFAMCLLFLPVSSLTARAADFVPRTTAPDKNNAYYYSRNPFYSAGYGMPNCTTYTFGRVYEWLGAKPKLSRGSAGQWWWYNKNNRIYAYGSEPRLGAVACWDQWDETNGHVAAVEAITADSISLSESFWEGSYFVYATYSDLSDAYPMRFLGYIYVDKPLSAPTTAAPLSKNCALSSLTVSNAEISPAFQAGTTHYTASVPFSVSKLDVKAAAADSKATIKLNNPALPPDGDAAVTITVTAESGAKKIYTIQVHREKEPSRAPSGDNRLSDITVEGAALSPAFSADVTRYTLLLPYEAESVKVSAAAADEKARVEVIGGDKLAAGEDTEIQVICTAENGEKRAYTVIARRAAPPSSASASQETASAAESRVSAQAEAENGFPWWLLLLIGSVCAGAAAGFLLRKKAKADG